MVPFFDGLLSDFYWTFSYVHLFYALRCLHMPCALEPMGQETGRMNDGGNRNFQIAIFHISERRPTAWNGANDWMWTHTPRQPRALLSNPRTFFPTIGRVWLGGLAHVSLAGDCGAGLSGVARVAAFWLFPMALAVRFGVQP